MLFGHSEMSLDMECIFCIVYLIWWQILYPVGLLDIVCTRWFKYDRDYLCVNKPVTVPVIYEPPCISWRYNEWMNECYIPTVWGIWSICNIDIKIMHISILLRIRMIRWKSSVIVVCIVQCLSGGGSMIIWWTW